MSMQLEQAIHIQATWKESLTKQEKDSHFVHHPRMTSRIMYLGGESLRTQSFESFEFHVSITVFNPMNSKLSHKRQSEKVTNANDVQTRK